MRKIILLLFLIPSLCFAGLRGSELTVLGDNENSCFIPKAGILPQESHIVGFWQLEEASGSIIDQTGVNNGTYNGVLYLQTGKITYGLGFDGSDDYVYTSNIGIAGNVELSISFWVKSTTIVNLGNFVSVGALSNKNLIGIGSGTTGEKLYLNYWSDDNVVDLDISPADHSLDFVHIVYTYNKTTEKLYANNVLKHTRNITLTFTDNPVRIGGRTGGYNGQYSNSVIDEVIIWNKALTPDEVSWLYSRGSPTRKGYQIK